MLHIDVPTLEEFKALAQARDAASVSIYVPTSPVPADARANRTAFKNLAKQVLAQIDELGIAKERARQLEERLAHLAGVFLETPDDNKLRYGETDPEQGFDAWRVGARGVGLLATPGMSAGTGSPTAPRRWRRSPTASTWPRWSGR